MRGPALLSGGHGLQCISRRTGQTLNKEFMAMIDRRLIRETPEVVRKALQDRGSDFDLDALIALEARRRELLAVEAKRAEKNDLSKQVGATIQAGGDPEPLKARIAELSAEIANMERELAEVEERFDAVGF